VFNNHVNIGIALRRYFIACSTVISSNFSSLPIESPKRESYGKLICSLIFPSSTSWLKASRNTKSSALLTGKALCSSSALRIRPLFAFNTLSMASFISSLVLSFGLFTLLHHFSCLSAGNHLTQKIKELEPIAYLITSKIFPVSASIILASAFGSPSRRLTSCAFTPIILLHFSMLLCEPQ